MNSYLFPPTLYIMTQMNLSQELSATVPIFRKNLCAGANRYVAHSPQIARLCFSDYVYIKGAPEVAFFTNLGASTDVLAVVPRNKGFGTSPLIQSTIPKVYGMKTSMSSIRSMNLVLADSNGDIINFGDPYKMSIVVYFDK